MIQLNFLNNVMDPTLLVSGILVNLKFITFPNINSFIFNFILFLKFNSQDFKQYIMKNYFI